MVNKPHEHPMDLTVVPLPKKLIKLSDEKAIDQEIAKEDYIIEVPRIDFILRDRLLK